MDEIRSIGSVSRLKKGRFILPPSIGHGEGSAGHRTASSYEAPQRILKLPEVIEESAFLFKKVKSRF
jgi:hypothetical protein